MITWLNGKSCEWKNWMVNQIYPAVLGTLIYMSFDFLFSCSRSVFHFWKTYCQHPFPLANIFNGNVIIVLLLVVVTLAFYLSDLFYIEFTREYRRWFFLLDILFLICMLFTIRFL